MSSWFRQILNWCSALVVVAGMMTVLPALAQDRPSFDDLLVRAQTQAAAGHRWGPPGNNMTETIASMMDMVPTATPEQLAALSALLQNDVRRSAPPGAQPSPAPDRASVAPTPDRASVAPAPDRASVAPAPDRASVAPAPDRASVAPAPDRASVASAEAREPPRPLPKPAPLPVPPRTREAELFARGQDAESHGDISGARRWYAAAADQGSATAARSVGRLYDPAYLKQTVQGGIDPDAGLARHWYERAVAMGDAQAAPLLQALASR